MARVQCKVGIKCLSCTEKQEGPTLVAKKCGHEFHISLRSKVRRHRDTKRQSGLPNLLLALSVSMTSAYSNLGVLQGFEPPTSATNSISLPLSHISCEATVYEVKSKNHTNNKRSRGNFKIRNPMTVMMMNDDEPPPPSKKQKSGFKSVITTSHEESKDDDEDNDNKDNDDDFDEDEGHDGDDVDKDDDD
jgi:hypothetical protein